MLMIILFFSIVPTCSASTAGGYWVVQHDLSDSYDRGELANVTGPNLEIYVDKYEYKNGVFQNRRLVGANVYLDGVFVGTTGSMLSIRNLEDRPYNLKIELSGYHVYKGSAEKTGHYSTEAFTGIFDPSKDVPFGRLDWYYTCSETFGNPVTLNRHMNTCIATVALAPNTVSASSSSAPSSSTSSSTSNPTSASPTQTHASPLSTISLFIFSIIGFVAYRAFKKSL